MPQLVKGHERTLGVKSIDMDTFVHTLARAYLLREAKGTQN